MSRHLGVGLVVAYLDDADQRVLSAGRLGVMGDAHALRRMLPQLGEAPAAGLRDLCTRAGLTTWLAPSPEGTPKPWRVAAEDSGDRAGAAP